MGGEGEQKYGSSFLRQTWEEVGARRMIQVTTHLSSKQLVEIKKGAGGRTDVGSSFILAKVLT